jgi:hypothetical protein
MRADQPALRLAVTSYADLDRIGQTMAGQAGRLEIDCEDRQLTLHIFQSGFDPIESDRRSEFFVFRDFLISDRFRSPGNRSRPCPPLFRPVSPLFDAPFLESNYVSPKSAT